MKKTIRCIWILLCGISLLLALAVPVISSYMQGYYKAMIDTSPEFLYEKRTWAKIGGTDILWVLFLIIILSFVITEIIIYLKNKKMKIN